MNARSCIQKISLTVYTNLTSPLLFALKHITCHALTIEILDLVSFLLQSFSDVYNEVFLVLVSETVSKTYVKELWHVCPKTLSR